MSAAFSLGCLTCNRWRMDLVMPTGTVRVYNGPKGFGFTAPDDGGEDVFVHSTALEAAGMRDLLEGR